jgi:hypothetical protein
MADPHPRNYFMCHRPGDRASKVMHATEAEAVAEAHRIADKEQSHVNVLCVTATVTPEARKTATPTLQNTLQKIAEHTAALCCPWVTLDADGCQIMWTNKPTYDESTGYWSTSTGRCWHINNMCFNNFRDAIGGPGAIACYPPELAKPADEPGRGTPPTTLQQIAEHTAEIGYPWVTVDNSGWMDIWTGEPRYDSCRGGRWKAVRAGIDRFHITNTHHIPGGPAAIACYPPTLAKPAAPTYRAVTVPND